LEEVRPPFGAAFSWDKLCFLSNESAKATKYEWPIQKIEWTRLGSLHAKPVRDDDVVGSMV
jgi:hypothetical protein